MLPASRVERFSTMNDGQSVIQLEVYQGEHSLCEKNQKIGEYELKGIPVGPAGQQAIDVRFSYDMNGVLDIDATIVSNKKTATFTIVLNSQPTADVTIQNPAGGVLFILALTNTKRTAASPTNSGVTNVRLTRPGYDPASTALFTNLWLDSIRNYPWQALRFMGALGTNDYAAPGSPEAYPYRLAWPADRMPYNRGAFPDGYQKGWHGVAIASRLPIEETRTVRVFTAPDGGTTLAAGQTLDGGEVLPGLALPLAKLFAGLPAPAPDAPGPRSRRQRKPRGAGS